MFGLGGSEKISGTTRSVDLREGINGLAQMVQEMFEVKRRCCMASVHEGFT